MADDKPISDESRVAIPKRGKAKSRAQAKPGGSTPRPTKEGYNFPKASLEECVRLAQAIEEKHAGNPMPSDLLVKAVDLHKSTDWRFQDMLRASSMFGITTGTGEACEVALTPLGKDIVAPASPADRARAIWQAFTTVPVFKSVLDFYGDKAIPEDEYFGNLLTRKFAVVRERVQMFSEVFRSSLHYARSFRNAQSHQHSASMKSKASDAVIEAKPASAEQQVKKREFLDSCFVLMPFGGWYDAYYRDVYSPAIKAAGMEPVRADDLFHSGSVVEQIWEEINKAKVLLAELTGKNANVFYELGLSHARRKPVVLIAGSLEDVPFDLRHLRIVTYDVRDPAWAHRAGSSITSHLLHAKADPSRSLPHPFRLPEGQEMGLQRQEPACEPVTGPPEIL